jgi:hypothetical protein
MLYRVELTIGHRRSSGDLLPVSQLVEAEEKVLTVFSTSFQGGQICRRTGGYVNNEGELTLEPCTVVFSFTESVDQSLVQLWSLAGEMAARLDQECILLTIIPVYGLVLLVEPTQ